MALDRSALTSEKARTLPIEAIDIPELGDVVYMRGMSSFERDEFEKSIRDPKNNLRQNIRARLIVLTACDAEGKRLFSSNDIHLVGTMRVDIVQRMWNAGQRLSGMSDADAKELGEGSDDAAAGTASS